VDFISTASRGETLLSLSWRVWKF